MCVRIFRDADISKILEYINGIEFPNDLFWPILPDSTDISDRINIVFKTRHRKNS